MSMDAPVVPTKLASSAPMPRKVALVQGVALKSPGARFRRRCSRD